MRRIQNSTFERLAGSRPVSSVVSGVTHRRVRVLAYHAVSSADDLRRHVREISRDYLPVSGAEIADAISGSRVLPSRAVWITFDDGDPSVVHEGLPVLEELGVPATMFVCPGLVESGEPSWWSTVAAAVEAGVTPATWTGEWSLPKATTTLKQLPDRQRRTVTEELTRELHAQGLATWGPGQLTTDDLRSWVQSGRELGNHSWDHPCLDRCEPAEQRQQVDAAQRWLDEHAFAPRRFFAYPNGNWSPVVEEELRDLDVEVALLHDHHLAATDQPPLRMSRLRVDTSASTERLRAILAGTHSLSFHAVSAVRSRRPRRQVRVP